MTMLKAPELLLPAGSLDKMRAAYDFGADAVYAGQPRYSLRARNNEFRLEQIKQGIDEAHARGKKFFVTSNLIAHNDKIRTYLRDIEPVIDCQPDALIMADAGLIMMVKEKWPEQVVHLSVQANTTNWAAVKFWQKMGVERVILSRELSLDEIEKIRQECPDMELEVFVHGALCIAYSGRCLLSGYFNHRDPNQGTCTNACRWNYATHDADIDATTGEAIAQKMEGDFNFEAAQQKAEQSFASTTGNGERHPKADKVYLIEEAGRPGQMMPIMEDEHGTYIMNSKDLRAVEPPPTGAPEDQTAGRSSPSRESAKTRRSPARTGTWFSTTSTRQPAASADFAPVLESSMARQSSACRPRAAAAVR